MKLLKFYQWMIGSMSDFCKTFQNNEVLYNQAKSFWNKLDSDSIWIVIIFVALGIFWAAYYYHTFNNKPGRHYKPKYWIIFLIVTFILTLALTLAFEYFAVTPRPKGYFLLEFKLALANSLYASVVYLFVSWIWCQLNLPTNAYRLIKF